MCLTPKGKKIIGAMKKEYGSKKGESVFYADKNKGGITDVTNKTKTVKNPVGRNQHSSK